MLLHPTGLIQVYGMGGPEGGDNENIRSIPLELHRQATVTARVAASSSSISSYSRTVQLPSPGKM